MSSTVENSIESLQLLVNERDATIALLKSRATSYVEKLKAEHTDSLTQEQTARQQLQDKLEAAKPVFIRLKDEKTALADQLNERTNELAAAETAFNLKFQEMQKNNEEIQEQHKKELLTIKGADSASSALVDNELIALKRNAAAALEKANLENETLLKKLSAQEELQKKNLLDSSLASAAVTATVKQLTESNLSLTSSKQQLSDKLAACSSELAASQAARTTLEALQQKLQAQLAAATEAGAAQAMERSKAEATLAKSSSELNENKKILDELQGRAKADALKIAAGQSSTGQIEELKSNLQQSEEQLQEAEETAWKAKAEASELLFALDQEQVSVKRMNEQIEKMRDETSKLAAEHALALESFQTRLKQQENNVKEENLKSGDVPLPLNGEAKHPPQVDTSVPNAADAKQPQLQRISDEKSPVSESHGQPLQASLEAAARLSAREEELKVSKAHALQAQSDLAEANKQHVAETALHAKRVLELEAGLKALKEKEEEQLSVALTAPATKKEDAATAKLAADLEAFTKECASLKAAHADYLKGAVEAQSAQVAKVAAAHDEKVSELERSHSLAITGSTEYISDLEAEIAAFKKKETEERAATESRFEGIQKELLAVTTKRDLDVKALEEQLGASKKQLEGLKTHSAELKRETEKEQSAGKDSLVTVAAEHSTAIAGLKTEHSAAIAGLKSEHSAAIAGLKSEHLKSITALKTEHSTALAAKEEAFNKLLQNNKDLMKSSADELAAKVEEIESSTSVLTAQCAELKRVGDERAAELEAARKKEGELTAQMEGLSAHSAELEQRAVDSAAAPKEADESVAKLTAEVQDVREDLARAKAGHAVALTSLQQELAKSESSIVEKTSELAKLAAQKDLIAAKADETEAGRLALAATLENCKKDLQDTSAQIQVLRQNLAASEKALVDAKEVASRKASAMSVDMQAVEAALGSKKSDFDAAKANLAATTTAYSALSAQHNQLKVKADLLTQQLEAEVQQTQERKLKVRAYVDNLNVEKKEMETVKQGIVEQLSAAGARISALEAQLLVEEQKLKREEQHVATTKQAAFLEQEQLQQEHAMRLAAQEALLVTQKQETARLQGLLDEHARATAEEVQEAYRQMALSGKELESHKAKRLVARNEMIGAAQALERSQSEGQALRAYIQYKLAPIVFEQVAALEMLLSAVEHFRAQLSTKGNVRLHNTASEFLARRLVQSGQPQSPASPNYSPESSVSSTNSNSALTLRNSVLKQGEETDLKGVFLADGSSKEETGLVRTTSSTGTAATPRSPSLNSGPGTVSVLREAMEQAELLRKELNRVHAGLSLLSHSVDRLGDIVTVDSRCCGGVFQMLSDSMSGSIEGTIRGSIVGRTLVSHNNTSSSGRGFSRSAQGGNKISSGLGYTTVSAEEGPSGVSYIGGQRRNVSPPRDIGSSNPMLKDGKGSSDMRFSINDDDDDGEELEII